MSLRARSVHGPLRVFSGWDLVQKEWAERLRGVYTMLGLGAAATRTERRKFR